MKLTINLLTWNGEKYISFLFDSLKKQTYKNWKLVILDNGSTDDTILEIKKQIADFPVEVKLIEGKKNLGFAKGHNKLISDFRFQISDYFLLLNQDMYLEPDCLEKLIKFMDENRDVAVVSPRLMIWEFQKIQDTRNKIQDSFSDKIDTLGLKVSRSRRVTEIATGEECGDGVKEEGDPCATAKALGDTRSTSASLRSAFAQDDAVEVFGVSGALPMFKKKVIDEVGLFDESFGSYKEDVDLAFRLRSAGYKAFVLLDVLAYHDRTAVGTEKLSIKNKKKQSDFVRYYSYRNHLITLLKNEYWQNFLLDFPWILWYELRKFFYFLLFDRKVLRGLRDIWAMRRDLKIKRLKIKETRRVSCGEMRKWFY